MRSMLPTDVPPYFWTIRGMRRWLAGAVRGSDRAERERRVGAAEAERVRQCGADAHAPRGIRDEVEIALRVLLEQVRRGRRGLVAQRERGEHGLDAAGGAEQVAGHRLGG